MNYHTGTLPLLPVRSATSMKRSTNTNTSFGIAAIGCILLIGYIFVLYSVVFPAPAPKCDMQAIQATEPSRVILAVKDTEIERLKRELQKLKDAPASVLVPTSSKEVVVANSRNGGYRPGLIVLGMHRSGTSIIGGLINKMGLNAGSPLIQAAEDNEKGFFERIDVVLQNDILMRQQGIDYSAQMHKYDAMAALKLILSDGVKFNEGKRGLKFLNDPANYPWMLKDPRLCVTFRTWLPLLNFVPAVLFTYRHPMDVALSFLNRYEHFQIGRSLRMWYVYNKRAIVQSHDLCRVTTSHRAVMTQPLVEMDRLYDDIRACGVMAPHRLTKAEVEDFVDPKLQHGKSAIKDTSCAQDPATLMPPATWATSDAAHIKLYREVMRVFCAMEDGSAFNPDFHWDETIKD